MDSRRNKIDELEEKRLIISNEIDELTGQEELEVTLPKCHALVGACMQSTHDEYRYAKLLEIIENTRYGICYLIESFHITPEGYVHFMTETCHPYTNREWWDEDIPISGWKRITETKYQREREKTQQEFNSMKKLRKFFIK